MTPRLKEIFNKEIQPALKNQFGFKNIYMAPRVETVSYTHLTLPTNREV